jgi:hypothetical protein
MQNKISGLRKTIGELKKKLEMVGDMRPGTLSVQYQNPKKKSGAYFQVSYTHKMRSRTDYVRKNAAAEVKKETDNYRKAKKYFEQWVSVGIELSKLKMRSTKCGGKADTRS